MRLKWLWLPLAAASVLAVDMVRLSPSSDAFEEKPEFHLTAKSEDAAFR